MPFDLSIQLEKINLYLQSALDQTVTLAHANPLEKSTRSAPWRLVINQQGTERIYVLRFDESGCAHEFEILKAMQSIAVPSPNVYGLDNDGEYFGIPCFLMDYVEGQSMLPALLAGQPWAEDLYLDSIVAMQNITRKQLALDETELSNGETAIDILEIAHNYLKTINDPLATHAYQYLLDSAPPLPVLTFSNGDLYPDNLRQLNQTFTGVIDFQHAGFSDPLFEFLLAFFVHPELRGRGLEERYCKRMGIDPAVLDWYHALEFYDTWHLLHKNDDTFAGYDAAACREKNSDMGRINQSLKHKSLLPQPTPFNGILSRHCQE